MATPIGEDDVEQIVVFVEQHDAIRPLVDLYGKRRIEASGVAGRQAMSLRVGRLAQGLFRPLRVRQRSPAFLVLSVLGHVMHERRFPDSAQVWLSVRHARYSACCGWWSLLSRTR